MQTQLIGHFSSTHGIREILFVGKYEKHSVTELVFVEHSVQFITSSVDTISIIGIHDKDESLSILVVVAPQRTNLILTPYIPNCK